MSVTLVRLVRCPFSPRRHNHSNQTSNYCHNGLSPLSLPLRCEKDKCIPQNVFQHNRLSLRISLPMRGFMCERVVDRIKIKRICLAAACTKSEKSLWARMCLKSLEEKRVKKRLWFVVCSYSLPSTHTHTLVHIQQLTHFNMLTEWTRDQPPDSLIAGWPFFYLLSQSQQVEVTIGTFYNTTGWRKTSPVDNNASPPLGSLVVNGLQPLCVTISAEMQQLVRWTKPLHPQHAHFF